MKALIILALIVALGLIFISYKRESDIPKMLFSLLILSSIIMLALMGTVMRSLTPLFLLHIGALILSYGGFIYYVFSESKQWILWSLPVGTLALYVLLAWIGNEHIVWF
jgi:Ca2+/Na+ antiporter